LCACKVLSVLDSLSMASPLSVPMLFLIRITTGDSTCPAVSLSRNQSTN
jgi:hypothetical protein